MGHNNYNRIAWCYDLLSQLVFGKAIKKAQTAILPYIFPGSKVLIVGGGTGWILEEISKLYSSGLAITYVDASEKMVHKSKHRNCGLNAIEFINKPVEDLQLKGGAYDVIITSFFFDNFSQMNCQLIFKQLHNSLKQNGIWLYADFEQSTNRGQYWQMFLLKFMYLFFRVICKLEANKLPDIKAVFSMYGYELLTEKLSCKSFIVANVCKNNGRRKA